MTTKITIPFARLEEIESPLKALYKKAEKLGMPLPKWTVGTPYEMQKGTIPVYGPEGIVRKPLFHTVVDVAVEELNVKVPGYDFAASVEHSAAGNIIYPKPGHTVDEKYRQSGCYCDHCKVKRQRNKLYIFDDLNKGGQIQIGSTCLRDFMGVDPAMLALSASWERTLKSIQDDDGWGSGGGRYYINLTTFMTATAAVIEHEGGYLSGTKAREFGVEGKATGSLVATALWPNLRNEDDVKFSREIYALMTTEMYEKAEAARKWASEENTDNSDYAWNIKVIATKNAVTSHKQFGMASSIYPSYLRAMGRMKERELARKLAAEKAKDSEFVGEVGKRFKKLAAQVTMAKYIKTGEWGDVYLYKFTTNRGEILSWFSSPKGLNQGDKVLLDGSVKEHRTYNDIKETALTRCKFNVTEKVV